MSRIGKKPVPLPSGVRATPGEKVVVVEGPKGRLEVACPSPIAVAVEAGALRVENPAPADRQARAFHGLTRALLANAVTGVTKGFERRLEVVGVGWNARLQGRDLALTVGYAHPVLVKVPAGLEVAVPQPSQIAVRGADRQAVGELAAEIRAVRPPEPYNGKGIKYEGEEIRRKAGKAFGAGAAGAGGG